MMNTNDPIYVTKPFLPPLEEFSEYIENIWESKQLTNKGPYHDMFEKSPAELFDGVNIWLKDGWGSREALIYNLTIDDGHKELGGRRFVEALGKKNEETYPWHTWVIFQKI